MSTATSATVVGDNIVKINGENGAQAPGYVNAADSHADMGGLLPVWDSLNAFGPIVPFLGGGVIRGGHETQHEDFNFRLWTIPKVLSLINPRIDANIPFIIWSTFQQFEELLSIVVPNSEVLTFDWIVGTDIRDGHYRTINIQIGEGEDTISTDVFFNVERGSGVIRILAALSGTFNLIPGVPVLEDWNFLTDVLVSQNGKEQRICLRRNPRFGISFKIDIIDQVQRISQFAILEQNIKVPSLVPFYQYCQNVSGVTEIGDSKIFCNANFSNFKIGGSVILVNSSTEDFLILEVISVESDGVTLNAPLGQRISSPWVITPAFTCLLDDGVNIIMQRITGELKIDAKSFREPSILRAGQTITLNTLSSMPVLEKRPLSIVPEVFTYRRDVIDNNHGIRHISSSDPRPRIEGRRNFLVQRNLNYEDMDYWRLFADTVRGSWKPFLLSTYLKDWLVLDDFIAGGSTINIAEKTYFTQFYDSKIWRHFEIEWIDGLVTRHTVISAEATSNGGTNVSFTPPGPVGSIYDTPVRISYLQKVRMADSITLEHYQQYTILSISITTVGEE